MWCIAFLILFLGIGFFVIRSLTKRNHSRGYDEPVNILKKRLASGEINETEYQKLRDELKK